LPLAAGCVQRIGVVATAAVVIEAEAVVVARVVIARIEVKHGVLPQGEFVDWPTATRTVAV
jgi:hypothetical protein